MRKNIVISTITLAFFGLFLVACDGDSKNSAPVCGNGLVENGETCDGDQFGQASCVSEGFAAGTLACTNACALDTSGCVPRGCGDGEALDGEHCDGADLRGKTCADRGFFGGGTLACRPDCTFDVDGCVLGADGDYTDNTPCEVGRPCRPILIGNGTNFVQPRVCVADPVVWTTENYSTCLPACERDEDCAVHQVCREKDGYSYCDFLSCDTPFAPCTFPTGVPGVCTPYDFAYLGTAVCVPSGTQAHGEPCVVHDLFDGSGYAYPRYPFQFVPGETCATGLCRSNDALAGDSEGTCVETLCDALAVLEGRLPDPCPESTNCMNTSMMEFNDPVDLVRSADVGACISMDGDGDGFAGVACHVVTQLTTRTGEACGEGRACHPWLTMFPGLTSGIIGGSLQGFCREVSDTQLPQGEACTEHAQCAPGMACVMADPFAVDDWETYDTACRRLCDATVFGENPACAGLPEGTTWVCLSVSLIFTSDHEPGHQSDSHYFDYTETSPSPLGFCVPDRL